MLQPMGLDVVGKQAAGNRDGDLEVVGFSVESNKSAVDRPCRHEFSALHCRQLPPAIPSSRYKTGAVPVNKKSNPGNEISVSSGPLTFPLKVFIPGNRTLITGKTETFFVKLKLPF